MDIIIYAVQGEDMGWGSDADVKFECAMAGHAYRKTVTRRSRKKKRGSRRMVITVDENTSFSLCVILLSVALHPQ